MDKLMIKYMNLCNTPSDINEHLPILYRHARECETIIETGVRGVISSYALTLGLCHNKSKQKKILLNDIQECNIQELLRYTSGLDISIEHKWCNNLELDINEKYDMIFIDTWHIYGQLKRELNKFSKYINKYIIMHDTTIDGTFGESFRFKNRVNPTQQSIDSGIPLNEILIGLWPAIEEFLKNNNEWKLKHRYTNNNGLTILEKITI
jgi:hypothetical protein